MKTSKAAEGQPGNDPNNILVSDLEDRAQWIQSLVESEGDFESPININLSTSIPLELPLLEWHHIDLPCKKMKLTNTGHTLILSAKWHQERPFLTGGPLLGNYVFSQLHFHWGCNDMEGSEHTVDGSHLPLEMHVVHFKSCYLTQEAALKEKDGMVVLAYFFKLQTQPNPAVQVLVDSILFIQKPHCSARLDPLPLWFFVREFQDDYFLYWGSVMTTTCVHLILWLICREPIGISTEQLESFRSLLDANEEPLLRNFRNIQPLGNRRLFHINPSGSKYSTLLPISRAQQHFQQSLIAKNAKPIPSQQATQSVY
ncbi:hypothetical protein ILUMI_25724 [Ignelater luminosus]|uniref:Alpha-carbonic anhydrase domain-containing protein n=1 Tax=Ignelater luminosus TaxID=2038154 RepID=A0A8K0C7V7_IGNLU|nr:hypothetical protein ILUMI_25724 [Ignelater luminosus]